MICAAALSCLTVASHSEAVGDNWWQNLDNAVVHCYDDVVTSVTDEHADDAVDHVEPKRRQCSNVALRHQMR